jgi:GxxExxY protein
MHENETGTLIVDSAVHLHRGLGPGLLETVDEVISAATLRKRDWTVPCQVSISVEFKGLRLDEGLRAGLIVAE